MGNTNPQSSTQTSQKFMNFVHNDWDLELNTTSRSSYGDYSTFKQRFTNEEIDQYVVTFRNQHQEKAYYKAFLERLREDYIVNSVYYESKNLRSACSSATLQGDAYIQHIPVRLCDITDIPFKEFLYILKLSLQGFKKMFKKVGYFTVKEELVCIDKEGTIRVWMNSDLSRHYPQNAPDLREGENEELMVKEIIEMIYKNTEDDEDARDHENLEQYFLENEVEYPTFDEALFLLNNYVDQYKINLPNYCESVIEIFREDYGAEFNIVKDDQIYEVQSEENMLMPDFLAEAKSEKVENISDYGISQRQSQKSYKTQSRQFMLSGMKEQSMEKPDINSLKYQKSSPHLSYSVGFQPISPPRIIFSYNGANSHQYSSQQFPPRRSNYHLMVNQPRISQKSDNESIISQRNQSQNMLYSEMSIQQKKQHKVNGEIYSDMMKYL